MFQWSGYKRAKNERANVTKERKQKSEITKERKHKRANLQKSKRYKTANVTKEGILQNCEFFQTFIHYI